MPQAKEREHLAIKDSDIGSNKLLDLRGIFVFVVAEMMLQRHIVLSPISPSLLDLTRE